MDPQSLYHLGHDRCWIGVWLTLSGFPGLDLQRRPPLFALLNTFGTRPTYTLLTSRQDERPLQRTPPPRHT